MMIRKIVIPVALFFILMTVTGPVFAQPAGGPGWNVLKMDDDNGDGKISPDEFSGPSSDFSKIDKNGDGFLTEAEVGPGRKRPPRVDKGPKSGSAAPALKLASLDGKEEFDLASFQGKKPVVLFFGSYT